jgi:CRISPR type I-E-associated protein CasB/Cse2
MNNTIENNFIVFLEKLVDDKRAMANLRRGLGKPAGTVYEMDRYILPFISESTGNKREAAYYTIASLFAFWHQGKDKPESIDGNLGNSLKQLVNIETNNKGNREETEKRIEKYLVAILNANYEDLPDHLRRIVSLLKSKVPLNWSQLLYDIQHWDTDDHWVQHQWAKGFWENTKQETTQQSSEDE